MRKTQETSFPASGRQAVRVLFLMAWASSGALWGCAGPAPETSNGEGDVKMMELDLQRRDPETGAPSIAKETIDPRRTLVLVIDAWEYHWCSTWTGLAGGRIPRMNRALQGARELGMTVVHAPTDAANSMAGTPQRERMAALPRLPLPEPLEISIPPFPNGEGSEGCMCHGGFGCIVNYGERAIHPGMAIAEEDLVSADAEEVFTWCKTKGITHIIYTGFATNMCLFGKPEGVRTMVKAGMRCILARDLTEAFYANQGAASADRLTNAAVEHIEKHLAPTIGFEAELREAGKWSDDCVVDPVRIVPWGFQDRPQVFKDSLEISMSFPFNPKAEIRYTLDGCEPGPASTRYAAPFEIRDSTTLRAAAFQKGRRVSLPSECRYVRQEPLPPMPNVFVSDLEPAQITMAGGWNWLAAPGGSSNPPPQRDRSYAQTPLQLRGQKFDKGMGVYAPCQLVYSVKPEYKAFVAQAGADESMLSHNLGCQRASFPSVVFRVFIDGELQAESPIMRISQPPWRFHVEIPDGAKVISLAVTDAGDGNREDLANWVNAGFLLRK